MKRVFKRISEGLGETRRGVEVVGMVGTVGVVGTVGGTRRGGRD